MEIESHQVSSATYIRQCAPRLSRDQRLQIILRVFYVEFRFKLDQKDLHTIDLAMCVEKLLKRYELHLIKHSRQFNLITFSPDYPLDDYELFRLF